MTTIYTLQWKSINFWSGRKFAFWFNNIIVGQLTFNSLWNYSAIYAYQDTFLKFSEAGLWKQKIVIQQEGKVIALIEKEFFGDYILQVRSGERFKLVSNIFGRNMKWIDEKGLSVVKYTQASFTSMGKGTISFDNTLPEEFQTILASSGLFTQKLLAKRASVVILVFLVIELSRLMN